MDRLKGNIGKEKRTVEAAKYEVAREFMKRRCRWIIWRRGNLWREGVDEISDKEVIFAMKHR